MSGPELVYLFAVGMYVVLFLLFTRFFFWKTYSEGKYWHKRPSLSLAKLEAMASKNSIQLPYFAILVPARDESDVIEKTVRHLAGLRYQPDRFEIIVVTDAKEREQNEANRLNFVLDTIQFLDYAVKGDWKGTVKPHVQSLALRMLSELCLEQLQNSAVDCERCSIPVELLREADIKTRDLLYDLASSIVQRKGRVSLNRVFRSFRRVFPHLSDREIGSIYPIYLCIVVPIYRLYVRFTGDDDAEFLHSLETIVSKAKQPLTRGSINQLSSTVEYRVQHQIARRQACSSLKPYLQSLYGHCFPTTQQIVQEVQSEWKEADTFPTLKHVEVPPDFDGNYRGKLLGEPVPSTKGRALNYALPLAVDEETEMCGFYDAESRPDQDVLLYVAFRRLTDKLPVRILQGPVFQVRNFYEMGPFSKIACLYQALSHDWYLPVVFKRLPFVGGTNLFVERRLLDELGGYDSESLTEDLELGTRAYLKAGAWPEYLPYPSSEQTPTAFRAFYRQRLRWGTGHLQVMNKLAQDKEYPNTRKRPLMKELFIKGPVEWSFYQFATLVPPTILILWIFGQVDPNVLPETVRYVLNFLSLVYITFTFYAYFRYRKHLDLSARPLTLPGRCIVVAQLLFLPLAAFFFPVPFTSALILKQLHKQPTGWTKTPRSKE